MLVNIFVVFVTLAGKQNLLKFAFWFTIANIGALYIFLIAAILLASNTFCMAYCGWFIHHIIQ